MIAARKVQLATPPISTTISQKYVLYVFFNKNTE